MSKGQDAELVEVFVSYAQADRSICHDVFAALAQLANHISLWYAEAALLPGDPLIDRIQEKLYSAKLVLVFITPNSLESTWVGKEVRSALSRHRKNETRVIPVI